MKVYFNNSCKICKAEIDLYKKEKIDEIDWIDITNNELAEKETSKDSKQLLRRLHVKDGQEVLQGAAAFLSLWKKISLPLFELIEDDEPPPSPISIAGPPRTIIKSPFSASFLK